MRSYIFTDGSKYLLSPERLLLLLFISHRHVFHNNIIIIIHRRHNRIRLQSANNSSDRATVQQWYIMAPVGLSDISRPYLLLLIDLIRICRFHDRFDFFGRFTLNDNCVTTYDSLDTSALEKNFN